MKKLFLLVLSFLLILPFLKIDQVFAASFSQASIRYDRMKTSTATSIQVLLVPKTVGTTEIKVTFGAGVTIPTTGLTVTTTNLPSGAVALPGTLTVASNGSSIVVTGLTTLTVGTTYAFNVGTGISTPVAAGQILDTIDSQNSTHTVIDSTTVASRFITDDQIVITGNVPPSFTFSLSGNTDSFTTDLSSSSVVSTTGKTVSVTTNASKGWIGWVKSANTSLLSATSGESINTTGTVDSTTSTCSAGTDCYVLDADKTTTGTGSGALSIAAEYDGTGTSSGGTLSTSLTPFATRTGKTNGDVITLIARASIISTKAAANDYTDTLTIIGAGNF